MRAILPWLRSRLSREWIEIPPDERAILFGSIAASVGIPLLVALVLDPLVVLLELSLWWALFLGLPAFVVARAIYRWSQGEESLVHAFLRDLRPDPFGTFLLDNPLRRPLPVVTFALVLCNVAIHYSVIDPTDYAMRMADPSLWVWTSVTSMFTHADAGHLWGNMLFLWIFGSALEPRISRLRYLACYLLVGSVGNAVSVAFHYGVAGNEWATSLGASGAISGVMGLFVVRCYFARVGVPIPIFGTLGAALPIGYRLQVNAMLLVGLYFLSDLSGARSELEGWSDGVNYWGHLGGYCFGVCLAYATGLAREGRREVLELRAGRPSDLENLGPDGEARDRILELDPENLALRVARARARSRYVLREDGREDYEAAIRLLSKRDPDEAARLFAECFRKYRNPLVPKEQLELTPALERAGELEIAARALELVAGTSDLDVADRRQALLHQARLLVAMGLEQAAIHVYEQLLRDDPGAPLRGILEAKLARCRGVSAARVGVAR